MISLKFPIPVLVMLGLSHSSLKPVVQILSSQNSPQTAAAAVLFVNCGMVHQRAMVVALSLSVVAVLAVPVRVVLVTHHVRVVLAVLFLLSVPSFVHVALASLFVTVVLVP